MSAPPKTASAPEGGAASSDSFEEERRFLDSGEVGNLEHNRTFEDVYREELGYDGDIETQLVMNEIDVGRGAEAYDAFLGLNTFAKITGYEEQIDEVLMAGGLSTEDPIRWGKRYKDYMQQLRDPGSDEIPEESFLEDIAEVAGFDDLEEVKDAHSEELEGVLNSKSEHRQYVRRRMSELLDGLGEADIKYFYGEEESFNAKEEAERQLNKMKDTLQQKKKSLEERKEDSLDRKEKVKSRLAYFEMFRPSYKALKKVHQRLQGFYNNKEYASPEELEEKANEYLQEEMEWMSEELEEIDSDYAPEFLKEIDDILEFDGGWESYKQEYSEVEEDWSETVQLQENLLEDLEDDVNRIESKLSTIRKDEEDGTAKFGNRQNMDPIDAHLIDYIAEEKIHDDIEQKLPERFRDSLEQFTENRAKIERRPEEEYEDDPEVGESDEVPGYQLLGDTLVIQGTNLGNSPSKYGLIRGLMDAQRRYNMDEYLPEGRMVPENVLVAHDTGGFQYTEINPRQIYKDVDGIAEEEVERTVSAMVAPVFQSADGMLEMFDENRGFSEDKRVKKDNDGDMPATGAMIQHYLEDGSRVPFFVAEKDLTWLGERTREVLDETEGSDSYQELLDEMERRFQLKPGAVLPLADYHLGAADDSTDVSKREKIARKHRYEQGYFGDAQLPVLGEISEWIDGDEAWFGEENLNHGVHVNTVIDSFVEELEGSDLPGLSEELQLYEEREDLTAEEYEEYRRKKEHFLAEENRFLKDFVSELVTNLDRSTDPHMDVQFRAAEPLFEEVIQFLDSAALVDGNHIQARGGKNESFTLQYMLEALGFEGATIEFPSDGSYAGYGGKKDVKGERDGDNSVRFEDQGELFPQLEEGTGKLFGFHHETRATKHFLSNIRKDFTTNYPYDEVMYNHIHRWGSFITGDGRAGTVSASVKNTDHRGEQSAYGHSTWGSLWKWTNVAERNEEASGFDWHAWHYAGPQTIVENTEFDDNRALDRMEEMEESVPDLGFDPGDIEMPERSVEEDEDPSAPEGAGVYARVGDMEVSGPLEEENVNRVIRLLEGEREALG